MRFFINITDETWLQSVIQEIPTYNFDFYREARDHIDSLGKVRGGLGKLEHYACQIAGLRGHWQPFQCPVTLIVTADHGIIRQNVTVESTITSSKIVTKILEGNAASSVICRSLQWNLRVLDIGLNSLPMQHHRLINCKVAFGTHDFSVTPAMTHESCLLAIKYGFKVGCDLIDQGHDVIALGEVGIGNTVATAALYYVLANDFGNYEIDYKNGTREVIQQNRDNVLRMLRQRLSFSNEVFPLEALSQVGGLEHAAMLGVILAGAANRVPTLLDGFVPSVSALAGSRFTYKLLPYILVSHATKDHESKLILRRLGSGTVLDSNIRTGEAIGAVFAVTQINIILELMQNMIRRTEF